VVADPDRDQVVLVDLDLFKVSATIALEKGDEPGRVVEDGDGRVHIALRRAGAVVTLDTSGAVLRRQPVCPYPRGLAYDAATDVIHVACAGGELVTLPASGGDPVRTLKLDRDLRDVVIDGDRLLVSRFRTAELLVVESDGRISRRMKPPGLSLPDGTFAAAVAWRTIPAPGGGALMVHQQEKESEIMISPGGYGGRCGGIVRSAVSVMRADGTVWVSDSIQVTLPVDIAAMPDGSHTTVELIGATIADGMTAISIILAMSFGLIVPKMAIDRLADQSTRLKS